MQVIARKDALPHRAIGTFNLHRGTVGSAQCLFGGTRVPQQAALAAMIRMLTQSGLTPHPVGDHMVHVIAAECRIAGRGQDLKHAAVESQNGNIERATTQIVNREHTFGGLIKAIGHGCRRGFVQEPQDIKSGQTCGIFGCLTLRVIEIGRDGDDDAAEFTTERRLGTALERFKNIGGYLHRAAVTSRGTNTRHAGLPRQKLVGQ